MSELKADVSRPGCFLVSGELVFATVPELLEQGRHLLATGDAIELDFNGVAKADSAGLALMVEWMRAAQRRRVDIVFRNIPEQILTMARVSGVDTILPLADDGPDRHQAD